MTMDVCHITIGSFYNLFSKKMKILLVTSRSDYGGGPLHVNQLLNNLKAEGFIPYLACPNGIPYGDEWRKVLPKEHIFNLPHRKFSVFKLLELIDFIKINKIELVHSHGNGAGTYSRCIKLFRKKTKIVHSFHGLTNQYESKLKKVLNISQSKFLKRFTDHFICVSNGEKDLAIKIGAIEMKKTTVVHNGIDDTNERVTYESNDGLFKIVTISRFDYQKNMTYAFNIAKLFSNSKRIKFIWIGDGPEYEKFVKKIETERIDNIELLGFIKEPKRYLKGAQLYLTTSRFEGLPYALIEANSLGLPIISTNVIGNNDVVLNNYNGFLFENVEEAVMSIKRLEESFELWSRFSDNSRNYFISNFTIENMINKIAKIYREIK